MAEAPMVACLQATAEACFPHLFQAAALGIFCDAGVGEVGGQGVLVLAHGSQLRRPCTLVLQAPFRLNPRTVLPGPPSRRYHPQLVRRR
jgi:hypothetical protein